MDFFALAASLRARQTGLDAETFKSEEWAGIQLVPEELDSYYRELFANLYAAAGTGEYFLDFLTNFAVQERSFLSWSWHREHRERIVVQVGGLCGFLATALGNPRQACVGLPWPWEEIPASLPDLIAQGVVSTIAPSGPTILRPRADFLDESPYPFIGTLLLRHPRSIAQTLPAIEPLLKKCDAQTEIIVCGTGPCAEVMAEILSRLEHESHTIEVRAPHPENHLTFCLARPRRPITRLPQGPSRPEVSRPVTGCLDRASPEGVHRFAPARQLPRAPLTLEAGHGLERNSVGAAFPYLQPEVLTTPPADYHLLHRGRVDMRGVVRNVRGELVTTVMPPYLRPSGGSPARDPQLTERLPGTWLYLPAGGMAHTHWLIEGLLRIWPAEQVRTLTGLISPLPLRGYQREMIQMALGRDVPVVELAGHDREVEAESLLAWEFCVGHSPDVRPMLSRMRSAFPETGPEWIFVRRSDRPLYRNCLNEKSVCALAEHLGFTVIDPGILSAREEVTTFSGARVIVGAVGAGLNNVIFSRPGAVVIGYTGRSYCEPHLLQFATINQLSLTLLFCEQIDAPDADPACELRSSSFVVDIRQLESLMRRAIQRP